MCLRDPCQRNSPGNHHHHHHHKSSSRLQLLHPKSRVIKIHKLPSAQHHHHHPAIKSLIGSANFFVQDLFCAETLSFSPTSAHHLTPAIARRHRASHGLHHHYKCHITKCTASNQIQSTVTCSFTINPSRNPGSSFQSKIIDLFPCYLNPQKIVLSPDEHSGQPRLRVDDATLSSTSSSSSSLSSSSEISADSDLDEAGKDSGVNAAATAAVAIEIISAKNMANVLEFEEAMGVLLKRESKIQYKLTHHYVQALMHHHHHHHSPNGTNLVLMNLGSARRSCVLLIFKLVEALMLTDVIAAHAVAFLDRFLCQQITTTLVEAGAAFESQLHLAATACLWIAAKMDDTTAPSLISLCAFPVEGEVNEEKLGNMEAIVLRVLGWNMLTVTTSDFVTSLLARLPLFGLPASLRQVIGDRAEELIRGILTEVEFLDYEPSVVSMCVMQCLLDETLPFQAASHMATMRTFLAVDTVVAQRCYKMLIDLVVDPPSTSNVQAPVEYNNIDHFAETSVPFC